ncbi:acyl-CoA dehydrogenase family protein [Rhizobium sp. DKSPLA3]|uniref:Acyl-CoA dehydrogenase family protein n=1 Tax=Rhizobium quercicola TaxID=2901226 RepID=A0A9X1NPT0_9HYPH|nr:acyl-CoA dehydrogenase family protein [Rhizobium quercicola]MCD7107789.1 acyl-CoA dehydrogenase family protein [Rhizobium quercicola]
MQQRNFTEEQDLFRQSYRKFLDAEVKPYMPQWRKDGIVPREIFRKAGDLGMLMIWPEEKYGGLGESDFRFEQVIIEETARAGCSEWYNTLHSRLVGPYFKNLGTEEQRERFLPKCVTGETILAVAMTEAGAGSDLAGMKSTAKDMGDHFLLNGSKTYISNGINADVVITAAKLHGAEGRHAMVLLIVERDMEGFTRGRNLDKIGLHAQDTAEFFFDNVKVPKENVLGTPGKGFYHLMEGLAEERLIASCGYLAVGRRAFDITRDYVMQREVFGKPLSQQQNTQFRMAEMDAELDIYQVYVDHCVAEHNAGRLTANLAAKAKMVGSELEWRMADLGLQMHGGAGYMEEYEISSIFTASRMSRIYAGSAEVMRYIIGRDVFSQNYQSILN